MKDISKKETIWEHCNRCNGKTKHDVLYQNEESWSKEVAEDFTVGGSDTHELLKCCGCGSVQYRHKNQFSEDLDPATGEPEICISYYPPLMFRKEPEWLDIIKVSDKVFSIPKLDETIRNLFREIYIALQNNASQLAILGIRALLETIMIDKIGDKGNFIENIKAFEKDGYISTKQREVLEPVIEAGHAAMHRGYKPKITEVARLMDITESIVETIYINESRIKGIAGRIPVRNRKGKG